MFFKKKRYLKTGNNIFLLVQTTCSFFFIQLRLNRCEIHCCRKRIVNQTVKEKKYFDILQLNIYIYIYFTDMVSSPPVAYFKGDILGLALYRQVYSRCFTQKNEIITISILNFVFFKTYHSNCTVLKFGKQPIKYPVTTETSMTCQTMQDNFNLEFHSLSTVKFTNIQSWQG